MSSLRASMLALCLTGSTFACDDGSSPRDEPVCERLQTSLCERTTECAVEQDLTLAVDADVFQERCLRSLRSDLRCIDEPSNQLADVDLCDANLHEIPCDRVAAALEADTIVAPTSSCSDYFGL